MTTQEFLTTWSRRWHWDDLVDDVRHEKIFLPDREDVRLLPVVRIAWQPVGLRMTVEVCLGHFVDSDDPGLAGGFRFFGGEYDEFREHFNIDTYDHAFKQSGCRELNRGIPTFRIKSRAYITGSVFYGTFKHGVYSCEDSYELQMDVEKVCYRMATTNPFAEWRNL